MEVEDVARGCWCWRAERRLALDAETLLIVIR